MDSLKIILFMMISFVTLIYIYIIYEKYEYSKKYTLQDIKLRKVDEKGRELFYCCSFYPWQQAKLEFIKSYYGIDSIVEDKEWGTEYKICGIRGPYRKIPGEIFEYELELKVISVQFEEEIVIENIPVKFYSEDKCRFDIGACEREIIFLYDYMTQQNYHEEEQIKELLKKLVCMRSTNLIRYSDLVKIKEKIENSILEKEELEKFLIYRFLRGILEQYDEYRIQSTTIINNGGQVNLARDNGEIRAIQNLNSVMDLRSNFAKRLDYVIEIMNQERMVYEEPITVGYICELMGEESENILRQYYVEKKEPTKKLAEKVAEIIGVNKKWLFKGTEVAIFDTDEQNDDLCDILSEVIDAEDVYIAIRDEGFGKYFLVIVKYNDIKYVCYKRKHIFFLSDGYGGRGQLMNVYDFLRQLSRIKNKKRKEIYPSMAYFPTEKEWEKLQQGDMYPAAIRNVKEYKTYIMDDFLDIKNIYRTEEQYRAWYGEEFVKCQKYIRNILISEKM